MAIRLTSAVVHAADRVTTPSWNGFYAGGQLGYSWGNSDWSTEGAARASAGSFEFFRGFDPFKGTGSYFGGLQAGYNYRLPSGVVIGFEADLLAPNAIRDEAMLSSSTLGQAAISETVEVSGTMRGRIGLLHDDWLF